MKYFFYGFGSVAFVCLLLGATVYGLGMMIFGSFSLDHDLYVLQEIQSPDARYVATSFADSGGGAAGWCTAKVNVRLTGAELPPSESVFATRCGTKVELTWASSADLTVMFSPVDVDFGVTQRSSSPDEQVHIHYIETLKEEH